jgi:hypothetical protein
MWQKSLLTVCSISFACLLATLGCTSTEPKGNTDPVVPEMDSDTPYPEDPDLGPPPGEEGATVEEPKTPEEDTPGELTEDPYSANDAGTVPQSDLETVAPSVEAPEETDDIGGAFEDPQPNYEPAPDAGVPSAGTPFSEAGEVDDIAPSSGTQVRYVKAILLNVRQEPNFKSPIVRRLLGGAKLNVDISGKFAKLQEGQWVHVKYLSSKPTKKVTWKDVQSAWKKSKYKDTWKPQK